MKKLQKPPKKLYFHAFTLVELIVVIVILAILATIAFLSFNSYSSSARDSTRLADVNSLNKGIELYQVNAGYYPTPEGTISTGKVNGVDVTYKGIIGDRISKMVNINKTPVDPLSTSNYVYGISYDKKYFQIGVVLESGTNKTSFLSNPPDSLSFVFPLNKGDLRGIENVYSASGAGNYFSKIKGNYNGIIRFSTGTTNKIYYIANIPSLLYNNTGYEDLLYTGTYYIANNNTNLAYQISPDITTNNKTADIIVQEINNSPTATLTGIDITAIVTNTGGSQAQQTLINNLFSGSTLSSFGGNIGAVSNVITNGASTQGSTPSSGDCAIGSYSGASTQTYLLSTVLNTGLNNTGTYSSGITNGTKEYTATLTCNNGTISVTNENVVNNCNSNYTWNSGTSTCVAGTQVASCTGLPANAAWNTASSITQTWNGSSWLPTTTGIYNTTSSTTNCNFQCSSGYSWNSVSCAPDSNTVLLLHFDGNLTNAGTNNGAITNNGASFAGGKFGQAAYFNGSSNIAIPDSTDWDFASSDFTIDFWGKIDNLTFNTDQIFYSQWVSGNYKQIIFSSTSGLKYDNLSTAFNQGSISGWAANTWYHLALVRNGSSFKMYKDGNLVASTTYAGNLSSVGSPLYLGMATPAYPRYFKGYIDEFRISKGVARRTATFPQPSNPY